MNVCVYGAASDNINEIYLEKAFELGKELAKDSHTLIFGAGATGVMGAVAKGAKKEGGKVIGVAPLFFDEPGVLDKECDELIFTDTMRERKQIMEDKADVFVMAPGGIGTMEEFLEIFTLKQLERHNKEIVVFNVNNYYDGLIGTLKKAVDEGFMNKKNLSLFKVAGSVAEVIGYINLLK